MLIIAVGAAYLGTKYILYPYILDKKGTTAEKTSNEDQNADTSPNTIPENKSPDKDTNTDTTNTNEGSQKPVGENLMNLYYPQLGNFTQKENASSLIKQLKTGGIFACILESQGRYKVVTMPYTEKQQAEEDIVKMANYSTEIFVMNRQVSLENKYSVDFITKLLRNLYELSKKGTATKDDINALNKLIKETIDAHNQDTNNEINSIKEIYVQTQKITEQGNAALLKLQNAVAIGIEQMAQ